MAKQRREQGTGGISQRKDGYWQGRYDAGTKPDGKRNVRYVYAKTEAECKRKLRELIKDVHSNDYINVQKKSVKDYMDNWLLNVKKNELKPKSFDRLEQTLEKDVYPYIGALQLQAIDSGDVQKMINSLRDSGRSHSSIKKAYDAVNACFKLGVIQKTVISNPALGVTVPSKKILPPKKIRFYNQDEAKLLCKQAMSCWPNGTRRYPLGAFVPLLINTGLRMGELLALRWEEDVDLENKVITVNNNLAIVRDREDDSKKKYKLIEQDSVKTEAGQERSIPLNEQAVEALLDLKKVTGEQTFVMTTKNGTHVTPRNVDRIFRRIATASGFPEEKIYGIHALRHTFATLLLSNGVDIKTVSELLGHSDITVTYNTYIHVIKEQKKKALATIPSLLNSDNVNNNKQNKQNV